MVLNPATSLDQIEYVLPIVDLVLIMSVNPGFGGQKFINSQVGETHISLRLMAAYVLRGLAAGACWKYEAVAAGDGDVRLATWHDARAHG